MTAPSLTDPAANPVPVNKVYGTALGSMYCGLIEEALDAPEIQALRGTVNLIFTSPPFSLIRKKKYGNRSGEDYVTWLKELAPRLAALLAPKGSIVIEIGNAWVPDSPTMSTLPLKALLAFQESAGLHLCQQIICHNPARLPSPAQWVTVKRIRLKDSYTHVWWMSKDEHPKADNRKVLTPYSGDMRKLLDKQNYNSGARPSGHVISERGFLTDHGGAIAANVLDLEGESKIPNSLLKFSNTKWDAAYVAHCREKDLKPHPARMRIEMAAFFIEFLTDPGDLVLDPFGGSNTTGAAAEELGRRWVSVEANHDYILGSTSRFKQPRLPGT